MPLVRNEGCANLMELLHNSVEPNNNNRNIVNQQDNYARAISESLSNQLGNQVVYTGPTITNEIIERARARDLAEKLAKEAADEEAAAKEAATKDAAAKDAAAKEAASKTSNGGN